MKNAYSTFLKKSLPVIAIIFVTVVNFSLFNSVALAQVTVLGTPPLDPADTMGERKTLIIIVNFENKPDQVPISVLDAQNKVLGGLNNFIYEASYQKAWVSGTAVGTYTLPISSSVANCPVYDVLNEAIIATDPDVFFPSYNHIMIILRPFSSCNWAGLGSLGSFNLDTPDGRIRAGVTWIIWHTSGVIAHEFGHNLGLHHASRLYCQDQIIKETGCTIDEYGDFYDVMGYAFAGPMHFNASYKEKLGWFNQENVLTLQGPDTGLYSIKPLEMPATGPQAIKILRRLNETLDPEWFYLEYRQRLGFDGLQFDEFFNLEGALVHFIGEPNVRKSKLLDMTPVTGTSDAVLPVGKKFRDILGDTHFTTIDTSPSGLTIEVNTAPIFVPQTPWKTYYTINGAPGGWSPINGVAAGYHFTPLVNGEITHLGGTITEGDAEVKLFDRATGEILASTSPISRSNYVFSFRPITPVPVVANRQYTVAVYLDQDATAYIMNQQSLPQIVGDIQVNSSTFVNLDMDPTVRPTNEIFDKMYASVDIGFVPESAYAIDCSDNICQAYESFSRCQVDCPSQRCGDGFCSIVDGENETTCGPDCQPCTGPDGTVIASATSKTYYQSNSVPYNSSCVPEERACNNTVLSGSYQYPSCIVEPPPGCQAAIFDIGSGLIGTFPTSSHGTTSMLDCATIDNRYQGTSSATCAYGNWTNFVPGCTPLNCGATPAFTNATVSTGGNNHGDTRTVSCDNGYTGTATVITCDFGVWAGFGPTCVVVPDLTTSSLSTTATAVTRGSSFILSNTATNQGMASAGGFTVAFSLSTDAVYGGTDDIAFSTTRSVTSLAAGANSSASTTLTVPSTTPLGAYYVCAKADSGNTVTESDEANNGRCTTSTIQIALPDLVMTQISGPASGITGAGVSLVNTVKNQGASSAGSFVIGFYLSIDATITTGDIRIGTRSISSLAAGASNSATTSVTIPATRAAGTYYIGAIADYNSTRAETNETNNALTGNTIVLTIGADLVMTAVSGPASGTKGTSIGISNTVKNQGTGSASSFTVGLYLSTDATITTTDLRIGTRSVSSLAVGVSSSTTTTLTIPATLAAGTYYIGAIADYTNMAKENNETNNARAGNTLVVQ